MARSQQPTLTSALPQPRERCCQLRVLRPNRTPRWYEAVSRPSGDDVEMEVEDLLPTSRPVRLCQVESLRAQPLVQELSDALRHHHHGCSLSLGDVPDVDGVRSRYDERVTFGGLSTVEERDRVIVLRDDVGGCLARDDLAEDAVGHLPSMTRVGLSPKRWCTGDTRGSYGGDV
jgi:hypothetical protein